MRVSLRLSSLVATLCVFGGVMAVDAQHAVAAPNSLVFCDPAPSGPQFEHVVRGDPAAAGSSVSWERWNGASVDTVIADRNLNSDCKGEMAGSGALVHIVNSSNNLTSAYFDVGWLEGRDDDCGGSGCAVIKYWVLYADWYRSDGTILWGTCDQAEGCWGLGGAGEALRNGTPCTFRIQTIPGGGGDDWEAIFNCGRGWTTIKTWNNTGLTRGVPVAETWRLGGTATGMSGDLTALKEYRYSDGTWLYWDNNQCYDDNATNWQGSRLGASSATVIKGSTSC